MNVLVTAVTPLREVPAVSTNREDPRRANPRNTPAPSSSDLSRRFICDDGAADAKAAIEHAGAVLAEVSVSFGLSCSSQLPPDAGELEA